MRQQFQKQRRDSWLLALTETKSTNEFCEGWDKFIKDRSTSDCSKWLAMCNRYPRKSQTIASRKPAQCNGDESPCCMCPSLVLYLNICSWAMKEVWHLVPYTEIELTVMNQNLWAPCPILTSFCRWCNHRNPSPPQGARAIETLKTDLYDEHFLQWNYWWEKY